MLVSLSCTTRRYCIRAANRSHIRLSDLIRPAKRPLALTSTLPSPRYLAVLSNMATLESITQKLASLSITPAASVSHPAATAPQSWRETLEASSSAPKSFDLIKIVAYKPKTAKTATVVPVVVIAGEKTDFTSTSIGRKLNLKDLRQASDEVLAEFFSAGKATRACPSKLIHMY